MTQDRKIKLGPPGKGSQEQTSIKNSSSILVFANRLADKQRHPLVSHTLNFVEHIIGEKRASGNLPGFEGSMVYSGPRRVLHQSFYTWLVESVLSLTVNNLKQCFGIWLNQACTVQTLANIEMTHLFAQPRTQSTAQGLFLNQPIQAGSVSVEHYESFRTAERVLQTISAREMSGPQALLQAHEVLHTIERNLRTIYARNINNQYTQGFHLTSFQNSPVGAHEDFRSRTVFARETSKQYALVEAHNVLRTIERSLRRIYAGEASRKYTQDFHLPSFQTIQPLLSAYGAVRAEEIRRESGMPVLARVFVAPQQNIASAHPESAHPDSTQPRNRLLEEYKRGTTEDFYRTTYLELMALAFSARGSVKKIDKAYFTKPFTVSALASRMASVYEGVSDDGYRFPTAEFVSRSPGMRSGLVTQILTSLHRLKSHHMRMGSDESAQRWQANRESVSRWPLALSRIEKWFEQKQEAGFPFSGVKTSSVRRADSVLLKAGRSGELTDINEDTFAPILNRELAARTIQAYNPTTGDQQYSAGSEFTFLRGEQQMRPPVQSYAFAQPARPTIVEDQMVRRIREKEVVEIVRKEVETAMRSRSPIDGLSRSDYSRIADHIYSSLARRLLMDRERSGFISKS
jgi:hypothetical protein